MDLQTLIEPTLAGMGYELVTIERAGRGLLRIFIDSPKGIDLDDCVKVSNHLGRVFMVENVDYERLEVSSPGTDRPLVKAADFERFSGERALVKLCAPLDGRKRFTGLIKGLQDGLLQMEVDGVLVEISLADVESARLAPLQEGSTRRGR